MLQTFEKNKETFGWTVYGALLFRGGQPLYEMPNSDDSRHPVYSITKTITSLAVGIAVDRGEFSLNCNLADCFGREVPIEADLSVLRKITIERLLTMSVDGYPFRPDGDDWLAQALTCPLPAADTKRFSYTNTSAYLVGAALERAIGMPLIDYLEEYLFSPLSIARPIHRTDPKGRIYGATGMAFSAQELIKLGNLCLQRGEWNGKQIVSQTYMDSATATQIDNLRGGYGYFIWRFQNGYRMGGKWGQQCIVIPNNGLVFSCLAHVEDAEGKLLDSIAADLTAF